MSNVGLPLMICYRDKFSINSCYNFVKVVLTILGSDANITASQIELKHTYKSKKKMQFSSNNHQGVFIEIENQTSQFYGS